MFTPAVRRRAFDDIVDQVERAVLSGELHPGDRLPSERELCTQFGVGRAALREALRTLEERGIVVTKVGHTGGIFICTPDPTTAGRTLSALILFGGADVRELAEFRISFEAETARWAARRATEHDVAALRRIAAGLAAVTAPHPDARRLFTELELAFHKQMAVASGNRIRVAVMAALTGSLSRAIASIEPSMTAELLREEVEDVQAVVAAVAAGDEDRASTLMRDHVTRFSALEIDAMEGAPLRGSREAAARACS